MSGSAGPCSPQLLPRGHRAIKTGSTCMAVDSTLSDHGRRGESAHCRRYGAFAEWGGIVMLPHRIDVLCAIRAASRVITTCASRHACRRGQLADVEAGAAGEYAYQRAGSCSRTGPGCELMKGRLCGCARGWPLCVPGGPAGCMVVESLILLGGYARLRAGAGHPQGLDHAHIDQTADAMLGTWGIGGGPEPDRAGRSRVPTPCCPGGGQDGRGKRGRPTPRLPGVPALTAMFRRWPSRRWPPGVTAAPARLHCLRSI